MISRLLVAFLLLTAGLAAQSDTDAFAAGVAAYEQARYAEAIRHFGGLVEAGNVSVSLYYNLANAYYRNEQPGPAVLYYEQALRLAPGNAEVRANLRQVREEVMDGALEVPPFFLTAWARALRDRLSALLWGILTLLTGAASAYGLYAWRTGATRSVRKRNFALFVAGLLLVGPLLWLALSRSGVEQHSGVYIVLRDNLPLREAPSEEARRLATLPEGYRLERQDAIDPWVRVTTPSGTLGWVDTRAGVSEVR